MPTASGSQRLAQHISVTPDIVKFENVKQGDPVCSAVVQVNNLDQTGPRSVRIKAPTTRWFRLSGATHTERIAPGLATTFEVIFDPSIVTAADSSRDGFHDCIKFASEGQEVELWVHALLPRPQLRLEGDLQFGIVGVDKKPTKPLQLVNTGQLPADFTIDFDKSLPLSVEPCTGTLQPGSSSSILVKLAAAEVGAIVGELAVSVARCTEPYRQSINAAVVQQSFEMTDATNAGISELNFGSLFFGEAVTRSVTVFNNGPAEARFDLSYGSKADMAAIAATENDGPSGDDQQAAFLRMARIRAKLREEKNPVVRVTPIAGNIAPYSTAQLTVTFRPLAAAPAVRFKAQPLTAQQQEQLFEYLLQVNLSGGKLLRLPIKGTGLAPHLTVTPQVMHFGTVPTYAWADQLVELCNTSPELPMHVVFDRSGPYFSAEPAELDLLPGATASVLARYLPKALGRHEASLSFQVVSSKSAGKVLSEEVVQVQGQSLSLGDKQPLPGGVTACPATFTKARAYVDEGQATISGLTAKKSFKRPALWETADNAYSLEGIGAQNAFGMTREDLVARKEHADQYTAFIRAGRTAVSKRYLTVKEGDETDINLGMKPYRGLSAGRLQQPRQYDPLWTVKQQGVAGLTVQRPASASVVANIPVHKEWPETNKERAECSRELPPEQLSKITVGPRQLDFGKVSPAMPAIQHFVVTNPLSTAIHVVLDTSNLEELSCSTPASQVIPACSTGKFQLSLRCHDVQLLKDKIQYCINGCHLQTVEVVAEVVAVTLELSCEELMFAFSLNNWDDYVEKSLIMENTHTFPVEFEWVMSSQSSVFSVSPASGTIEPKSSCPVVVRWAPGHAAPAANKGKTGAAVIAADAVATVGRPSSKIGTSSKDSGKATGANATTALEGSKVVSDANAQANTAVTVNLTGTGGADAAAVADAAALGCQQTGFMSLKLKGGADAAPKKVMLLGELPAGLLKFKEKEISLGPVPVHEQQTVVVQLKNYGNAEASYRVKQHTQLQVSPDRGHVPAESIAELEVLLTPQQSGQFAAMLKLEVRGGKPLKLPIRAEGVLPCCHVEEGLLKFPDTFIGASSQLPLTLINTTPVPATLICDLIKQPEFDIMVGRDAWAGAGYAACPVQKIGANGEVSTVGSKRASMRTSRRMTSQGGKPPVAGDSGYRFLIQMKPSSTLPLQLVYRPSRAQPAFFPLPMVLHGTGAEVEAVKPPVAVPVAAAAGPRNSTPTRTSKPGSASSQGKAAAAATTAAAPALTLAVPVTAAGVVPKLISSKTTIDFESQVVRNSQQPGKSPYVQEVYARNNTEGVLQVAVGAPSMQGDASGCMGVYAIEGLEASGDFVSLDPGEGLGFTVRFNPKDARAYEAFVPVYIDGNRAPPYLQLRLAGAGMLPQLTFSVSECLLPLVPLNVTSRARFFVINGGYDNLELSVRLPPDTSRLPISLAFPEGNLIGLAKDRLPVDVSFCSGRAQSFTAMVDFLDEGGRAFSIAVTGATDSCSLTHQPFMQANANQLQLVTSAEGSQFIKLEDSPTYEMPWDEALGPQHLTEGIVKYLSAVTSRAWDTAHRADNSHGATQHSPLSGAVENVRQSMRASKGKQLMELVEVLGGKAVSLKGAGSKKTSGNKTETAHQALAVYDAILTHLRIHGGLVNSVKAEYLLDMDDFDRIMEERTAAAAGNPEQERLLELWAPVEQGFGSYSAQAWNTVLLQVFRLYILARITPASLRQLLETTAADQSANSSKAPASSSKATAGTAAKPAASGQSLGIAKSKAVSAGDIEALPAADAAGAVSSAFQVPDDELLASSNIYSVPETCLLTWMSVHMAKAFPQKACQVTNFSEDLRNGLVLGALLAAHWPSGSPGSLLTRLHQTAEEGRHLRENQENVVKAMQALCLPYEVTATDLDEADPSSMLMLVTYLFTALPQLLPRATLDFTCKLAEQQVRDIQLANPTRRVLSYAARLEGSPDFSLEAGVVKIDSGRSIQVPVRFTPTTSVSKSCRLVLMSRRDGSSTSAATLVFLLRGQVDSRAPLKQVVVQAPLYQLGTTEFNITNPFPSDCDFTISLVQHKPPVPLPVDKKAKGIRISSAGQTTAAAKAASAKKAAEAQLLQQQQAVANLFPEPFGLDRHRIRLRAGASDKLKLSFLPFQLPPLQQSDPAVPGKPPVLQGLSHSLLVLSDPECGEFAYELSGEVVLPGPFLEQKATVGLEGTQTVEVQLPFNNHLLESARRTYADKHPLAKDKEQAAKLRSDIGRTGDKGERLLEYTVTCSNSLLSCPQNLVLKAGTPAASASATVGRLASVAGGPSPPPSPPQHQQHPASDKDRSKDDNVLKLQLKPLGTGVYPARLTLTSAYDVRVIDVEVSAQSMGQSCMLEMECPARQQVLQEVALVNTTDAGFSVAATLTGKGFSGPRDISVPGKTNGVYPLTFCPPGSGTFTGTLELYIAATGERNVYNLVGKGGEPLAEGHLVIECQARNPFAKRLQVPNIVGALPLVYNVYADLEILSGPSTHACTSTNRGDTYKLNILPLRSGTSWGSISFVTEDGQYCWYSIEVKASEPPDMGTIQVSCPVRQAVGIQVTLTNPTDKPLLLWSRYSTPSLVGPTTFIAPPKVPCVFECFYAPLLLQKEQGVLRLVSEEAGEFWWQIHMDATPGGPEHLPLLTAPLGRTATHTFVVGNPTSAEAHFSCSSSDPARFQVTPEGFTVPPQGLSEVCVEYRPGSLGVEESGTVTVTSETAGNVEYICKGQGEMPSGCESTTINSGLGATTTSSKLSWVNPFNTTATVQVQLSSRERAGTFNLLLPGVQPVIQQQQAQLQRQEGILGRKTNASSDAGDVSEDGRDGGDGKAARELRAPFASTDEEDDAQMGSKQTDSLEGSECEDDDGNGHLERAPPAGLQEAMGGLLGTILNKARLSKGHVKASSHQHQHQKHQQPQVVPQQVAEVLVPPNAALQLPVSFCPAVLRESDAELSVSLLSPEVPAPEQLTWKYQVQGLAFMDAKGVKFSVKCKAKHSVEEVIAVPLPGVDPAVVAAIACAGGQGDSTSADVSFSHELIIADEDKAALANAVTVQKLDQLPVYGSNPVAGQPSMGAAAAADCPPVLRYKLAFAPQKAVSATVQLAVACSSGARWVYEVKLMSTAPEVEGVLTLEAHMGCTAELPLVLYSSGPRAQPFTAEFTPDTPLNFDVLPVSGLLPPATGDCEDAGAAAAPMKVTFLCKEMGKVITGRLVVVTPDSQHTFIVKGRQPAYVPPSREKLPSGTYLTAGTASTTARFSMNQTSPSSPPLQPVRARTASSPHTTNSLAGTSTMNAAAGSRAGTGRNYLQHNIRAAKSVDRNNSCSGPGGKTSTAARPWS